jgi:1,4-dihydroxy-6-naphthoate synthase
LKWRGTSLLGDEVGLNQYALQGRYDITKVSSRTYLNIRDRYRLLDVGAAMGYGCGPLVISNKAVSRTQLTQCSIAFPGAATTAYALFKMLGVPSGQQIFTRYDNIVPMLLDGRVDCGVIIHESRFTLPELDLHCLIDLGAWWEQETRLPLPLGCAVMKQELYADYGALFEQHIRQHLQDPCARPAAVRAYIRSHAQELRPDVIDAHIALYVNDFTAALGKQGRVAFDALARRLESAEIA